MTCSRRTCACPQCAGLASADEPSVQDLAWGLAVARARDARGFWGTALVADMHDRGGHAASNPPLADWLDNLRLSASVLANTRPTLGAPREPGGALARIEDFQGWIIPSDEWQNTFGVPIIYDGPPPPPGEPPVEEIVKKKCCPKGPPTIKSTARSRERRIRQTLCGMFWEVEIKAEFLENGECSCDCCELRLYVSYRDKTGGSATQATDDLLQKKIADGPLYTGPSRYGMTAPHSFPGFVSYPQTYYQDGVFTPVTFVEDVSFGADDLQPADVPETTERSDLLGDLNRYGDRGDPNKTSFSADGCTVTMTDHPRLVLKAGQRGWLIRHYKAIVRTKPHCKGRTARKTAYTLMGTAHCERDDSASDAQMSTTLGDTHTPWPSSEGWRRFRGNQRPLP